MTIGDKENKIILNLSTKRKSEIILRKNQNKIFQTNPEFAEMLTNYNKIPHVIKQYCRIYLQYIKK